jgi:putative CocE/NonD family hydrolase
MQNGIFRALALAIVVAAQAAPSSAAPTRHPDAPDPESPIGQGAQVVTIPLRDGTSLKADLYLPSGTGRFPVLMEVTPYSRRSPLTFAAEHAYWTGKGYAYLIVDARGTGESGGSFSFMADARRDGPQIVEWAADQAWSAGKVGMRGSSYSGTYPLQTAIGNPRGLACISPNANLQSAFDGPPYLGGAFMQAWAIGWTPMVDPALANRTKRVDYDKLLTHRPLSTADVAAHGFAVPVYRQLLEHQTYDSFWAEVHSTVEDYRRVNIPALAFTGWYDTTLPGTISNHRALRALAASSGDQWIVIGPWDHAGASEGGYSRDDGQPVAQIGVMPIEPLGYRPAQRMAGEFFDWCLKGTAARPAWSPVQMFVPGQNRWIDAESLQVAGVATQTLYLGHDGPANAPGSGGRLLPAPRESGADRYIHDPANPIRSETSLNGRMIQLYGPESVSEQLKRPDVLTFATEPLSRSLTLLGHASLELHVKSDAPDTDFIALMEDVAPDGSAIRLGSGWAGVLRTRYRLGPGKMQLMQPGATTALRINLLENGHTLRQGHRLRLSVFSSAYPFISINPNTGNDIATDTAPPRKATQTVLHGKTSPSALRIEILEDSPPASGSGAGA